MQGYEHKFLPFLGCPLRGKAVIMSYQKIEKKNVNVTFYGFPD